jgi:hypothetical protein
MPLVTVSVAVWDPRKETRCSSVVLAGHMRSGSGARVVCGQTRTPFFCSRRFQWKLSLVRKSLMLLDISSRDPWCLIGLFHTHLSVDQEWEYNVT